jgi:hypothetical protein
MAIKCFSGVRELCLLSTKKEFVCLSTKSESFIYHLTPDTLQFNPFMKIDTRVRVFLVQKNRMIWENFAVLKSATNLNKA